MATTTYNLQTASNGDTQNIDVPFPQVPNQYEAWQSVQMDDAYASYIFQQGTSSVTADACFHMENPGAGTITQVRLVTGAKGTHWAGVATGRLYLRINGVVYYSSSFNLPGVGSSHTESWDVSPASGKPFAQTEVTDLQAGIEMTTMGSTFPELFQAVVECDYLRMEVDAVDLRTEFVHGPPRSGVGFDFFKNADLAIVDYLAFPHTNAALASIADYLSDQGVKFQSHRWDNPKEAPSSHPIVYVSSFLGDLTDWEARTVTVNARTSIRVWASQANPEDAANQCGAVASSIGSMLAQTWMDEDGTDWASHFPNFSPPGQAPLTFEAAPVVILQRDNQPTGTAHTTLTVRWYHQEVIN